MPIYEYRCQSCGHELEKLQKISDAALKDCPACKKSELVKRISAAGFRLKGEGWYETDFKKTGQKNLAGDAKESSSAKKETAAAAPAASKSTASSGAASTGS